MAGLQLGMASRRGGPGREVIGPSTELYVDANGGYTSRAGGAIADRLAQYGMTWFEEPTAATDGTRPRRRRSAGSRLSRPGLDRSREPRGWPGQTWTQSLDTFDPDSIQIRLGAP